MNRKLNSVSASLCVACLSSDRKVNILQEDENKQIFHAFFVNSEFTNHELTLCFECKRRLNNALEFKKQVNRAQNYLVNYMKNTIPESLSTLSTTKTDFFTYTPSETNKNSDDLQSSCKKKRKITNKQPSNTKKRSINNVLPVGTLQKKNLPRRTLQKSSNQSGILKAEAECEIKIEWLDEEFELKKELEENQERIEEEHVQVKKEDSLIDSDDSPSNNVQVFKHKVKKIKKEKKGVSTRERTGGVVDDEWVEDRLRTFNLPRGVVDVAVLSWGEVESERERASVSPRYTQLEFRCQHCVVGFNHVLKLNKHMERHAPEAGDFECEVCKTRFKNANALISHKRKHFIRWRCLTCSALFSVTGVAADHAAREHSVPAPTHTCHVCYEDFPTRNKLRNHMHCHREKQSCEECGKIFTNAYALRTHKLIHTGQKDFECDECGKKFRLRSYLDVHKITHRASEPLYCAECDMTFKNAPSYNNHMKYTLKHMHPDRLKYACEFCPRRFINRVRLEEHKSAIHLNRTPHKCTFESCTDAFPSRPALNRHVRVTHTLQKLEKKYICHTCGKAFALNKTLQEHIRCHTGERPFSCSTCPSTFSHRAALYNHNKLVHKVPFVRRRKPGDPPPACPAGGEAPDDTQTGQ